MFVRKHINNQASLGIMHKERTKTSVRYRIKLNTNTTTQRQTQRIPTSCEGDGKETKGRRISVQKQKRGIQIRTMKSRFLVGSKLPKGARVGLPVNTAGWRASVSAQGVLHRTSKMLKDCKAEMQHSNLPGKPAAGVFLQGKH